MDEVLAELENLADFVDALLDGSEHEAHDLLVNSGEDMVERARELITKHRPNTTIDSTVRELVIAELLRHGPLGADDGDGITAMLLFLLGEPPAVSTGICGSTTYGYGTLDANGYWQFMLCLERP